MSTSLIIIFRTIHIFAGVLWVGSAIFYLFFVDPAVKAIGPAAPKFMENLIGKRRYPVYMASLSLLTVLAGGPLYWNSSGGLNLNWIKSGPGIGFTIGSVVSIGVLFMGMLALSPRGERIAALGKEIGMAGGPPTPKQAAEMHKLERELAILERVDVALLVIALLTMATARYWGF
jgi:uncharacterized membrane protein